VTALPSRFVDTALDDDGFFDLPALALTVERVQAYIRREAGAWSELSRVAREDPDGTTRALLALGTVLLDIAAGAYRLSADEMLDKVSRTLAADDQQGMQAVSPQSRLGG
jgi:hypothetical protein